MRIITRLATSLMAAAAILSVTACAGSIGVVPAGPDSWMVSEMRAAVLGGGPAARDAALAEAEGFCAQYGRVFVPIQMGPAGNPYGTYGQLAFNAQFRCLTPDDPAVARMQAAMAARK